MSKEKLPEGYQYFRKYLQKRDKLCQEFRISKQALAMGYVKKRAHGAFVIFGAEDPQQIEESISVFNKCQLPDAIIYAIEKKLLVTDVNIINPSNWKKRWEVKL